jgi:hypothetical protein
MRQGRALMRDAHFSHHWGLSYFGKAAISIDFFDTQDQQLDWLYLLLYELASRTALALIVSAAFGFKESSSIIFVTSAVQPV